MQFTFTKYAENQWNKLEGKEKDMIEKKLREWKDHPELFLQNIKKISAIPPATHRVRVGSFRLLLLCDFSMHDHLVLKVGHRREIYH